MFNIPLGTIPDILMGKKPMDALRDNVVGVTGVLTGGGLLGELGQGASESGGLMSTATQPATWYGEKSAAPGLLTQGSGVAKDINPMLQTAAYSANLANTMMPKTQTPQMPIGQGAGSQAMTQLFQQGQQQYMTPLQQAEAARMQRRNQWG